jgi:hypothetical protein
MNVKSFCAHETRCDLQGHGGGARVSKLSLSRLQDTDWTSEAEPLFRQALAIFEKSLGPDHPSTVAVRANL